MQRAVWVASLVVGGVAAMWLLAGDTSSSAPAPPADDASADTAAAAGPSPTTLVEPSSPGSAVELVPTTSPAAAPVSQPSSGPLSWREAWSQASTPKTQASALEAMARHAEEAPGWPEAERDALVPWLNEVETALERWPRDDPRGLERAVMALSTLRLTATAELLGRLLRRWPEPCVVRALGSLRLPAAERVLIECATDTEPHRARLRGAALQALANYPSTPDFPALWATYADRGGHPEWTSPDLFVVLAGRARELEDSAWLARMESRIDSLLSQLDLHDTLSLDQRFRMVAAIGSHRALDRLAELALHRRQDVQRAARRALEGGPNPGLAADALRVAVSRAPNVPGVDEAEAVATRLRQRASRSSRK